MMRLHDDLSSGNGYKVQLLLTRLGIPFERVEYDIDKGETRDAEFLQKINPNGRIPVLEI
jgi:glutathione S-transferase